MDQPTHRQIVTNGIEMHLAEQGDGPLVVLCHGFPELWYSWRHQIGALAAAGYRVVAPDMRGYGRTQRPEAVEAYDIVHLCGDLVGLLDALGERDAVFVGHDWGAVVAWNLSLLAPERVRAVGGLSVPFVARSRSDPMEVLGALFAERFFYIVYFQEPGVADAELGADPEATLRRMMKATPDDLGLGPRVFPREGTRYFDTVSAPRGLPEWLTEEDLALYVGEFTRTGFTGGLNWYRNISRNWALTEALSGARVAVPAMFLAGELDPVGLFMSSDSIGEWVPDLRAKLTISGAGHWVQQERPGEVNAALLDFLGSLP